MKPLAMEYIENLTFDEIAVGQSATLVRTLKHEDIQMFTVLSGDLNPTHVDPQYAKSAGFRDVVGHGMWGGILVSNVLGNEFPGPGTVYVSQTFSFERPVRVGDTLTVTVTCRRKFEHNHHIVFDCKAVNQMGEAVVLKVPHHGSQRNVEKDYFARLRAKHYLISADGKYDNPDLGTLEMISAARPDDAFTLHLTYPTDAFNVATIGKRVAKFFSDEKKKGRKYKVKTRKSGELGLTIKLG